MVKIKFSHQEEKKGLDAWKEMKSLVGSEASHKSECVTITEYLEITKSQ